MATSNISTIILKIFTSEWPCIDGKHNQQVYSNTDVESMAGATAPVKKILP
jgi:hypothetical protein